MVQGSGDRINEVGGIVAAWAAMITAQLKALTVENDFC
jgi:hypothetical protein